MKLRATVRPSSNPIRLVALLLGFAFSAFYAGTSRGVFVFGDDILMQQVTASIWERGEVTVASPHWRGDNARSILGLEHNRYAKYGLGQSIVALPFYGASHRLFDRLELTTTSDRVGNLRSGPEVFGTGLTNAAIGGATVAVTFLVAVELGFPLLVALMTAFCLGAATLLAHYASTFLSEPLSALCLAAAVLGLVRAENMFQRPRAAQGDQGNASARKEERASVSNAPAGHAWLALSGFSAGLLVATKVAFIVVVIPMAAWVAYLGWTFPTTGRVRILVKHFLYWIFFFALWLVGIAAYNYLRFGTVFETGYGKEGGMFSTPLFVGLSGLLVTPAKGIVWYSPIVLLGVAGWPGLRRRREACAWGILGMSVAWLLLISRYYQWYGGGCWGPRFVVPLLPLWILPSAEIFARFRAASWFRRAVIVAVVLGSLAVSAAPLLTSFDQIGSALATSRSEVEATSWQLEGSVPAHALALLPRSTLRTVELMVGRLPVHADDPSRFGPTMPDFAFAHYGSHALLDWTRGCFLIAGSLLAIAAALARPRVTPALAGDDGPQG
ncbi:MAG: hypothetical protein ABI639_10230 [Thermoanaerobaculia bacterium]